MMEYKLIIGVDVSNTFLDYCSSPAGMGLSTIKTCEVKQIANTVAAISKWLSSYDRISTLFVLEPTGSYSDKVIALLGEYEMVFSLVNPQHSHHFSQMLGITSKDDKQAAQTLTYMGLSLELPLAKPASVETGRRKRVLSALHLLDKEQRRLSNHLHALAQYKNPVEEVILSLERIIEALKAEKKQLVKQLKTIKEAEFDQAKKLAKTVKGVGEMTANWLLTVTNGLTHFENDKQLIKFIGLAPKSHHSGSSVRSRGRITKYGSAQTRACLYMGAISAIQYNHACKELYERLRAKGKPHYKAMVAVMAKLLKQTFAVVKSGIPFDNDHYLKYKNC